MRAVRAETGLFLALGALLAAKMVALEPLRPILFGVPIEVVAVLLPLALFLRWPGIAAMGIGCGLAHSIHGSGLLEGLASGLAVAGSLAAVHLLVRAPWDVSGNLLRCLALAVALPVALGVALGVTLSQPLGVAIAATFASVLLPIAGAGPLALLAVSRLARRDRDDVAAGATG